MSASWRALPIDDQIRISNRVFHGMRQKERLGRVTGKSCGHRVVNNTRFKLFQDPIGSLPEPVIGNVFKNDTVSRERGKARDFAAHDVRADHGDDLYFHARTTSARNRFASSVASSIMTLTSEASFHRDQGRFRRHELPPDGESDSGS